MGTTATPYTTLPIVSTTTAITTSKTPVPTTPTEMPAPTTTTTDTTPNIITSTTTTTSTSTTTMKTTTTTTTTTTITTTTTTITTTTPATTTATTTTPGETWSQWSECDCETGTRTRRQVENVQIEFCYFPGDFVTIILGGCTNRVPSSDAEMYYPYNHTLTMPSVPMMSCSPPGG